MESNYKPKFSGHQTFTLRHSWLPKAVALVLPGAKNLTPEETMQELGVGKNMVDSIKYWIVATKVCSRENDFSFKATPFGERLLKYDPFLEDIGSVWLLHWNLVTGMEKAANSGSAYFLFNKLRRMDFKLGHVLEGVKTWYPAFFESSEYPSDESVQRDIDCIIRCYAASKKREELEDSLECPLLDLELILPMEQLDNERWYRFNPEASRQMPDWVLAYSIANMLERTKKHNLLLSFDDIAFADRSPGSVFKMSPDDLLLRLERLDDQGVLQIDEASGVRNIIFRKAEWVYDSLQILDAYLSVAV